MTWLGIDTGGTFTDFVWYSAENPEPQIVKVPSDWSDLSGVLTEGLRQLARNISDADRIVLGTTLATNIVLEGDGARVATVTTRGYRDVVEIGRQSRFEMYNLKTLRRAPLSPRRWRHELDERTEWNGTTTRTPSEGDLDAVIGMVEADDVDAVAVCFLFSYLNAENEQLAASRLKEGGNWFVSASHEIARQSKEYERFATTLLNAFVGPKVDRFLVDFEEYLLAVGSDRSRAFLMAGNGGGMTTAAARVTPVRIINSGPAGGTQASIALGRLIGVENIITCDMGGTSTDVCLIKDLEASVTSEGYLDRRPYVVPHVDLVTIGTGGGSIAWIDIAGELEIGPRSAGSTPGPACYGRGGIEPTVTDANMVLGRLCEERPLGGSITLQRRLAEEAVSRLLPNFEALSLMELSEGIIRLAVARMATALREVSVARGLDPRDFTLVAYGGAGPMHASELARELEMAQVVVPPIPGNFSAFGLVMSDVRHDFVQSRPVRADELDVGEYGRMLDALEEQARARLRSEGFSEEEIEVGYSADMRFAGQWFDLNLPLPRDPASMEVIDRQFREAHLERYGVDMDRAVEFVNFRAVGRGLVQKPRMAVTSASGTPSPTSVRDVYLDGEVREIPVFDRLSLTLGATIEGPAIIDELGSTTVVARGFTGRTAATGAFIMTYEAPLGNGPAGRQTRTEEATR